MCREGNENYICLEVITSAVFPHTGEEMEMECDVVGMGSILKGLKVNEFHHSVGFLPAE